MSFDLTGAPDGVPIARIDDPAHGKYDRQLVQYLPPTLNPDDDDDSDTDDRLETFELEKPKRFNPTIGLKREVILCVGKSGSGKSYISSEFARAHQKLYRGTPAQRYLISRLDPTADGDKNPYKNIDILQLPCTEIAGVDIHQEVRPDPDGPLIRVVPPNSLFILDDIDTLLTQDKEAYAACLKLLDDLLETARHGNMYAIVNSHLIYRGNSPISKENKKMFNELHKLYVFPRGTNRHELVRTLERHFGIKERQAKKTVDFGQQNSRWIGFGKDYPWIHMERGLYVDAAEVPKPAKRKKNTEPAEEIN
jgi:hypothetical protein